MAIPPSEPPRGLWNERVRIAQPGGFAFRPGELLVRREVADLARRTLEDAYGRGKTDQPIEQDPVGDDFVRFTAVPDPVEAIDALHRVGVLAQVNHVVFSHCCCPPHPASPMAKSFYASPYYANVVRANPYYANPYYANPYYANPWDPGGACCSSCSGSVGANPYYANPYYANADPSPFVSPEFAETGRRRRSARPAEPPGTSPDRGKEDVRITILDTGYAEDEYAPGGLPGMRFGHRDHDAPDEVGDDFLDPAAGHGTFIAGVIEQVAPGCELELIRVLSTYGDGDEAFIVTTLETLAQRPDGERPHFVNLSFGAYAPLGMGALAHAVTKLQEAGTVVVASASCLCGSVFSPCLAAGTSCGTLCCSMYVLTRSRSSSIWLLGSNPNSVAMA
jgi:hypothetical protein